MSETKHRDTLMFKSALLSSTFLITGASATSALLPNLQAAFPDVSKATIQTFFSITALPQFIALLLAGILATKLGKKAVILIGALLWTVSGLLPMMLNNFSMILVSRVFLGFSLGLIQPIGTSMIADFYEGDQRATLMGFQSAIIGVSGSILTFAIGLLLNLGWRMAFLIYLVGLIVFALTWIYLPKVEPTVNTEDESVDGTSKHLGKEVITWVALTFCFNLGQGGINFDFNMAVVEEHIASATGAANMMVAYSVLGLITGIGFGAVMKVARTYGGLLAAGLFLIGNLMIATTHGVMAYYLAMMCAGAGFGLFMPYMFTAVNQHTTAANSAFATGATTAAASLANFIAPYIYSGLAHLFGNSSSQFAFYFASGFCALLVIGLLIIKLLDQHQSKGMVTNG